MERRRRVMVWLAVPTLLYLACVLVACGLQRMMLFPAPRPARTPSAADATLLHIDVGESRTVALFARAPEGAPTVVYFHGNGEQLADLDSMVEALHARGLGVYAIEYPGYGVANGSPTETTILAAARAALERLHGPLGVPRDRTVLLGQSLGTGVAMAMAAENRGARVILLSPYTSIADVAQRALPWLPARWLVQDRFDSYERAATVHIPALVVHGDRDEVIPFALGQRLAQRLGARFLPRPGRHHNDLWMDTRDDERSLMDEVVSFARGAAAGS